MGKQIRDLEAELDEERKQKVSALNAKKKLEADFKDLESTMEMNNKMKEDALKQLKKLQVKPLDPWLQEKTIFSQIFNSWYSGHYQGCHSWCWGGSHCQDRGPTTVQGLGEEVQVHWGWHATVAGNNLTLSFEKKVFPFLKRKADFTFLLFVTLQEDLSASERQRRTAETERDDLAEELSNYNNRGSLLSDEKRRLDTR